MRSVAAAAKLRAKLRKDKDAPKEVDAVAAAEAELATAGHATEGGATPDKNSGPAWELHRYKLLYSGLLKKLKALGEELEESRKESNARLAAHNRTKSQMEDARRDNEAANSLLKKLATASTIMAKAVERHDEETAEEDPDLMSALDGFKRVMPHVKTSTEDVTLNDEELESMHELFHIFDADGNGVLDIEEFRELMDELGRKSGNRMTTSQV
jgi:chromosome segregation ATPase